MVQEDNMELNHESDFFHEKDYASLSEKELLQELKNLNGRSPREVAPVLKEIKRVFDEQVEHQKEEALKKFTDEGGVAEDFEMRLQPHHKDFMDIFGGVNHMVSSYFSEQEDQKKFNLVRKQQLLEELREIVDSPESQENHGRIKEIQTEWHERRSLPSSAPSDLYPNYKALLDRYYNNRSLLFELKKLDRERNLKLKISLCEKAEKLLEHENINEASEELNHLHEEFKTIGPVPEEENETIWQRFKSASDTFHDKRRSFIESFKKDLEKNIDKKKEVIEKLKPFSEYVSESIDDWKKWGEEVSQFQEDWKKAGQVPNDVVKDLNREFWSYAKSFFDSKRKFFKKLDQLRKDNLKNKEELCLRVENLLTEEERPIHEKANEVKQLQKDWKKVGPVPKAYNDKIFDRFRKACDQIFNNLRASRSDEEKEYKENLELKQAIIKKIAALDAAQVDEFKTLVEQYSSIGFVPKENIRELKDSFAEAGKNFVENTELEGNDKTKLKLEFEVESIKDSPNAKKKLYNKRTKIIDRIRKLKSESETIKTNMDFFALSKSSEKIISELQDKVDDYEKQIVELQEKLSIINDL